MSTKGYGIWIKNYTPGTFDLNATDRNNCIIKYAENKLTLVFDQPYEMSDINQAYTLISGRSPIPPAWAFAPLEK